MDEYAATVKSRTGAVNACAGTLSDFGEHLSSTFLIPAPANRRGGLLLSGVNIVCLAFPLSPSSHIPF